MEYLVISFTHKNTNISTREKLAFNNQLEKETFLKEISRFESINEAILLSTCNRVELILSVSKAKEASKSAIDQFSIHSTLSKTALLDLADKKLGTKMHTIGNKRSRGNQLREKTL